MRKSLALCARCSARRSPITTAIRSFEQVHTIEAARLGMSTVAVTEHGNMFSSVVFHDEAVARGIKPILGCEVYVAPGSRLDRKPGSGMRDVYHHLVLLARDARGYRNLMKLCSAGYTEGFYYKPRIDDEILREHREGLIGSSACLAGEIPGRFIDANDRACQLLGYTREELLSMTIREVDVPEQARRLPGIIAAVIDCHTVCTAIADVYRAAGQAIGTEPYRWCVTAALRIDYLAPTPIGRPVEFRARVREASGRKRVVECTVRSDGKDVARAEVIAVEVPAGWGGGAG